MKKNVAVLGAGKIGKLVTHLLARSQDYAVHLVDSNLAAAQQAALCLSTGRLLANTSVDVANFSSQKDLAAILKGKDYVLSCAPFYCNQEIAYMAKKMKVNYLDLTEDIKTTAAIKELSKNAHSAFIPQCGLAPGFISIVTKHLVNQFEKCDAVKMRVGALPLYPHNRLKYNLTWSTAGLINEYCNPCEVIVDGKLQFIPALEGLESFCFDGTTYEAFYTSGGLGTLAENLEGKVSHVDYKSIRYPGHHHIICTLLDDLKFAQDKENLKNILERSLPYTSQDVVILFVTATGQIGGRLTQKNEVRKIYHTELYGEQWGAIQMTTAAGICAVLDLHAHEELPKTGFIYQEDVSYHKFIANRFGKYYTVSIKSL